VERGVAEAVAERVHRLFVRLELEPGESRHVSLAADPRLLARFDEKIGRWIIAAGTHRVALGKSAMNPTLTGRTELSARQFGV